MDMYCAIRDYGSIVLAKDLCWVECEKSRFVYGVCLWQVDRLWSVYRVASVSCGRSHALVLSVIGVVFSCGLGSQGQLGHGTLEFQSGLRVVEALEGLRMGEVCAGGWHSMALSDTRDVYVWGWNNDGQLGLRQTQVRVCVCVCVRSTTGLGLRLEFGIYHYLGSVMSSCVSVVTVLLQVISCRLID